MSEHIQFTDETDVSFATDTFEKSRIDDLDLVTDIEYENGEVVRCEFDISQLTHVTLNYNAMEKQRYGWRRTPADETRAQLDR